MENNNKYNVVLTLFSLGIIAFNQVALSATTPARQDQLRIQTGTPKRIGDSLFSYTVEWRVDDGLTYRGTGILFINGPDKSKPTSDIQIAKKMVSALNGGMIQQYPSLRGVLTENTKDKPEISISNKSGFSFSSITFRDYSNQKIAFDVFGKSFNAAEVSMAIDLVLSADVDYIDGFTIYKPTDNHHGNIEISIDGGKPLIIRTDGKTTRQLEQEIASALGPANLSTTALFPNLSDRDTRNNKPFDGSEVQLTNLAAKAISIDINDPSLGVLTKFKFKNANQSSNVFDPVIVIVILGPLAFGYMAYIRFQAIKQHTGSDNSST